MGTVCPAADCFGHQPSDCSAQTVARSVQLAAEALGRSKHPVAMHSPKVWASRTVTAWIPVHSLASETSCYKTMLECLQCSISCGAHLANCKCPMHCTIGVRSKHYRKLAYGRVLSVL